MKFGLLTVTYSGLFYDGPALSVERQIHKAKQLGFDALAIENYEAFVRGLRQIGYDGYLVSEYCLPALERHRLAGIDAIDRATRQALEYMKRIVQTTAPLGAASTATASAATAATATAASTFSRKHLGI